jgi:fatty acid/phospholipid biosynthesis enzyme
MNSTDDSNSRCRIVVDAMGGDFAPLNEVVGAIQAYNQNKDFDLSLIGRDSVLKMLFILMKLLKWEIVLLLH